MNARLEAIGMQRLRDLALGWPGANALIEASRLADPLFEARFGEVLLGFVGFVPPSTLSDSAYVWVHTTSEANQHRLVVARLARRWMATFHSRYPTLFGHCVGSPGSMAWLGSLGAQFATDGSGLIQFTIEANHD
jgi:hypothetical protein